MNWVDFVLVIIIILLAAWAGWRMDLLSKIPALSIGLEALYQHFFFEQL